MAKYYWEVIESVSGWNSYRIPAEGVTEIEARQLVNCGKADEYFVRKEESSWQIESVELVEKDD